MYCIPNVNYISSVPFDFLKKRKLVCSMIYKMVDLIINSIRFPVVCSGLHLLLRNFFFFSTIYSKNFAVSVFYNINIKAIALYLFFFITLHTFRNSTYIHMYMQYVWSVIDRQHYRYITQIHVYRDYQTTVIRHSIRRSYFYLFFDENIVCCDDM